MKEKGDRINYFLLQEQFPDIIGIAGSEKGSGTSKSSSSSGVGSSAVATASYHNPGTSHGASNKQQHEQHSVSVVSRRIVAAEEHASQVRLESCRCPHLQEYLPRILDLTVCRTTPNQDHPRGWTLANPVHALHMVAAQSGGESSSSKVQKQRLPPTFMYGDEHHRTIALQTEGIAEYWCSFDGSPPDAATPLSVQKLLGAAVSSSLSSSLSSSRASPKPTPGTATTIGLPKYAAARSPKEGLGLASGAKLPALTLSSLPGSKPVPPTATATAIAGGTAGGTKTPAPTTSPLPDASGASSNPGAVAKKTTTEPSPTPSSEEPAAGARGGTTAPGSSGGPATSTGESKSAAKTYPSPAPDPAAANAKAKANTNTDAPPVVGSTGTGDKSEPPKKTTTGTDEQPGNKTDAATKEAESSQTMPVDAVRSSSIDPVTVHDENKEKSKSKNNSNRKSNSNSNNKSNSNSNNKSNSKSNPDAKDGIQQHPAGETEHRTTEAAVGFSETKIKPETATEIGGNEGGKEKEHEKKDDAGNETKLQEAQTKRENKQKPTQEGSGGDVATKDTKGKTDGGAKAKTMPTPTISGDDRMEIDEVPSMLMPDAAGQLRKGSSATDATTEKSAALVTVPHKTPDTKKDPKVPGYKLMPSTTKSLGMKAAVPTPVTVTSNTAKKTKNEKIEPGGPAAKIVPTPFKSDPRMDKFRREEEKLRRVRRSLTSKRVRKKTESPAKDATKKKRKVSEKSTIAPGWKTPAIHAFTRDEEAAYAHATKRANETTERWMRQFRDCHESFWVQRDKQEQNKARNQHQNKSFYLNDGLDSEKPSCQWCDAEEKERACRTSKKRRKECRIFAGDELMKCLDCGFVGCSPPSLNSNTKNHMSQHMLITGHKFAISCGEKAQLFCSECGDCVYHEVFEQEKIRIACTRKAPHMAWNGHDVLRSFDPFQFLKTADSGILWKGLVATYPPLVPKEHFCAAQLTLRRQALFEGNSRDKWILPKSNALYFAASQHVRNESEGCKIVAPVGIYNLGNTCFMSSILQCLVFCKPLQQYFLRDSGHHFKSCEMFRRKVDFLTAAAAANATSTPTKKVPAKSKKSGTVSTVKKKTPKIQSEVCLACEMDRLYLSYYGAAVGNDVFVPIEESSRNLLLGNALENQPATFNELVVPIEKGDPLIISDLLTSAWKSGGMNHLTGYDQHDAHEFLNSFLELLGKHILKFRHRIHAAVTKVYKDNAFVPDMDVKKNDIIKNLFEGSFRSVLLCEGCGGKRVQQESFMNVSLSLSEEVERMQEGKGSQKVDEMSVESCLEHFIVPEKLGDLVYCSVCGKKTPTKKQHTFAKLPKILCLHLKRFDATKNKKIENFVSFPRRGLNMGSLLSHWCEVTRLDSSGLTPDESIPSVQPKILYDLFGTVNHVGNMQSGHYVANVNVDEKWYHCNDQHISYEKEESVLKAEGAYVLFYIRR